MSHDVSAAIDSGELAIIALMPSPTAGYTKSALPPVFLIAYAFPLTALGNRMPAVPSPADTISAGEALAGIAVAVAWVVPAGVTSST